MSEKIDSIHINYDAPKETTGGAAAETAPGTKLTPDQINKALDRDFFKTNTLDILEDKIKFFDRASTTTKESEIIVEIEANRQKLLNSILDTEFVLVKDNLNHENDYPYQSSHGRSYLNAVVNTTEEWSQSGFTKDKTKALIKLMNLDAKWALALYENQEGIAHRVKYYYAGADKIKNSMLEQKKSVDMENIHTQYSGSDDVLLSAAEKSNLIFNVKNPQTQKEVVYQVPSLREKAIKYQDSFRFWSKAVAAVARWDYEKKTSKDQKLMPNHPCMREDLAPKMIRELFRENDDEMKYRFNGNEEIEFFKGDEPEDGKFPRNILHFFNVEDDTPDNRTRYYSLMMALMEKDAYTKIKNFAKENGKNSKSEEAVSNLIAEVKIEADRIFKNFGNVRSVDDKLKELVIKSGITHYQGVGSVAPLSPVWRYEERRDSNGNLLGFQRMAAMGPLSVQGDDWSPYYHLYHDMYYDLIARKRSSFEIPTISNFRERYLQLHPEEKPDIPLEEARKVDPEINYVFNLCLSDTDEAKRWRKENRMEIDEVTRKVALQYVHFIMSPYRGVGNKNASEANFLKRYADPRPGKAPNNDIYRFLLRPTFIPPTFNSVNLYEVMYPTDSSWVEGQKKRTAWQMECDGMDPSEIDYLSVDHERDDYNQTSQHMAGRLLNLKTEVFDPERDGNYQSFFANPGGVKEIIKRVGLGWRGEKWFYKIGENEWEEVPKETREILLVSEFIALGVNMNEKIVANEYLKRREKVKEVISRWINMDEYMPPEKAKIKNYNSGIANLTFLQLYLLDRMGIEYGPVEESDVSLIYENTVNKYFKRH